MLLYIYIYINLRYIHERLIKTLDRCIHIQEYRTIHIIKIK